MKWLAGLFAILLILVVVAADRGQLPGVVRALYAFPGGDKVGHFVLLGILSFLVNVSITARQDGSRRIVLASLAIAVLVTIEEWSQVLFGTRSPSWEDLASSCAGIAFSAGLVWLVRRHN
ncbi:MAG: VanZ family protein [Chloroflexi bacterium]|nr:VanZ family protein [Chloroflexota bacterium]